MQVNNWMVDFNHVCIVPPIIKASKIHLNPEMHGSNFTVGEDKRTRITNVIKQFLDQDLSNKDIHKLLSSHNVLKDELGRMPSHQTIINYICDARRLFKIPNKRKALKTNIVIDGLENGMTRREISDKFNLKKRTVDSIANKYNKRKKHE